MLYKYSVGKFIDTIELSLSNTESLSLLSHCSRAHILGGPGSVLLQKNIIPQVLESLKLDVKAVFELHLS